MDEPVLYRQISVFTTINMEVMLRHQYTGGQTFFTKGGITIKTAALFYYYTSIGINPPQIVETQDRHAVTP